MISKKLKKTIDGLVDVAQKNKYGYFNPLTLQVFDERKESELQTTGETYPCHVYATCKNYKGVEMKLTHSDMGTSWE